MTKTNLKARQLKKTRKKDMKIDMMSVTWHLNICMPILRMRTCEHCNDL